jgi:hypothetical protein
VAGVFSKGSEVSKWHLLPVIKSGLSMGNQNCGKPIPATSLTASQNKDFSDDKCDEINSN